MANTGSYELKTVRVRLRIAEDAERGMVRRPEDAAAIASAILDTLDADQEHFLLLALNTQHEVIGFKVCASGGQDSAQVDARVVFRNALLLGAVSVIFAHNHPSGNPEPSGDDRRITEKLAAAGEVLGVTVLDHLTIGRRRSFVSLKQRGALGGGVVR
jgi:DNA repair protein RadC